MDIRGSSINLHDAERRQFVSFSSLEMEKHEMRGIELEKAKLK